MKTMTMTRRLLLAAALCAPLAGCGNDNNGTGGTGTGATGSSNCVQTLVGSSAGGALGPLSRGAVAFTLPTVGRLDITVDWTNANSTIGLFLAQANTCSIDQFNANSCTFTTQSPAGGKPRRLQVANAAAGAYELFIVNFDTATTESVSAEVVLSQGTDCPAFTPNGTSGPGALAAIRGDVRLH